MRLYAMNNFVFGYVSSCHPEFVTLFAVKNRVMKWFKSFRAHKNLFESNLRFWQCLSFHDAPLETRTQHTAVNLFFVGLVVGKKLFMPYSKQTSKKSRYKCYSHFLTNTFFNMHEFVPELNINILH